jgi:signal transduction histidine kinase
MTVHHQLCRKMGKKLLLLSITVICYNVLFSQQKTVDSLKTLLQSHATADTEQVNIINNLAKLVRRSNPNLFDSLVTSAVSLSDQLNYKKGKGTALTLKAVRYYDMSNFPAATQTYEQAKLLLESANDIRGLSYLLRMRANLVMDEGDYAKSLDDFLQGLKLAEQAGDIKQAIEINRTVGYLYDIIGDYEKAVPYQNAALHQAESIGYKQGMSGAYNAIGKTYKTRGMYPASLEAYMKNLRIDEEMKDSSNIAVSYSNIGDVYERMGKYKEAFDYLRPALAYNLKRAGKNTMIPWDEWAIGKALTHSGNPDSGLYYAKHSYQLSLQMGWKLYLREITYLIAESAAKLKQWDTAYKYQVLTSAYKDSLTGVETTRKTVMLQATFDLDKKQNVIDLQNAEHRRDRAFLIMVLGGLITAIVLGIILLRNNRQKQKANALLQKQKKEIDDKASELSLQKDELQQSYSNIELLGEIGRKITSSLSIETVISTVYDNVNTLMDASIFGIGIYNEELKKIDFPATYENGTALPFYSNSIYDQNRFAALCFINGKEIVMGDLETEYQNYLQQVPAPKQGDQPISLIYLPLKVKDRMLGVITVQSFQRKAYSDHHLFMLRNIAVYTAIGLENAESFKKLNETVDSLKKTQKQLIQSEKMASLGELIAGIAHEIQNPLNFVNNFSEVNKELLDEMNEKVAEGNYEEVKTIAKDVADNQEKINFHGKRADAIVKGMLQHSRTSSGQKEPTDINALVDEYLRLAYHGLRAKDKSFHARFETDFDNTINNVTVVPQEIGRVILNLLNNAFYSVTERKKLAGDGYTPTVNITTRKKADRVEIKVNDNGNGVPQKILDKIFQPFFTTKPAGQGTGLGLSLSYDIVTKGHGGELKIETREGEGSSFIILLPI